MAAPSVLQQIVNLLNEAGVPFTQTEHPAVYTSEEAARVRGTSLSSGAKALICKGETGFAMFVMPADRKLASKLVRTVSGWRKFRFASREEVAEISGLEPGSIPPFGSLLNLQTYCDQALSVNEQINFNAGDHEISISMTYDDYVRVERPIVGEFTATDSS